jgi:MGT family glycosyltransferase
MARTCVITMDAPGHVFPFIPICTELGRRGHDVQLYLLGSQEGSGMIAGIPTWQVRRPEHPVGDGASTRGPREVRAHVRAFEAEGAATADVAERLISALNPDLLIVDPMLWGAMISCEASGIPWVSVSHNPMTIRPLGLDVRGPGIPPPRGPLEKIKYRIASFAHQEANGIYLPLINDLRRSRGLGGLKRPWERLHLAPLTIAATAMPFEYERDDWPSSVKFVGPLAWEPETEEPRWMADLDERPLVLLAGSSIPEHGSAAGWVATAIEALRSEPVQVIATVPTDALPEVVPSNFRFERFVPHSWLLPRVDCVVCHGGPGITMKALAAGVPVVAVPFAYDRFEVAQRVAQSGAGVMLRGERLSAHTLREAVREGLGKRQGASRIAAAFAKAGGASAAADEIECLLHRAPGLLSPRPS